MSSNFSISNETKEILPTIDFHAMKETVLGVDYNLSLVITSLQKIQGLNNQYRHKNAPTDILSFPLSENEGEIHICPEEARKESFKFKRNYKNFLAFLFIHGCVHLKGHDHGSTMEQVEVELRAKFGV